ncbi:MAG: helix-hairpin-helix domain-containing protein [Nitrospira sp.]|nr:helix-hairpin-helix domain-containing protein [Nitrospira sp.]MCY4131062.1 helix-hairpin-helix domain-containing protein [Nitrospira sp.]
MRGWSIKNCPTVCSFGVKLLLLAGTMGFLSLAGLLQGPTQPTQSEASLAGQAGVSMGRVPEPRPRTVTDVGHVDINHGSVEELQRLPGIGPVLAERVVQYRRENGKFATIRDMQQVKGIGPKRFAQLEPYIYVEPKIPSTGE